MDRCVLLLLQLLFLQVSIISAQTLVGCMAKDQCLYFYNETITRYYHVTRCMAHGQNVAEIDNLATSQMIKDSGHTGRAWLWVEFTENSQWTYVNGTTLDTAPVSWSPTESKHCAFIDARPMSTSVVRSTLCNQDYGYICQRHTSGSQTSCDFMSDDNSICYFVGNLSVNWYAARYQCSTLYAADLVLAEDHMAEFLYDTAHVVRSFGRYWVGLSKGSWTNPGSSSQALIYTNWANNQPDNTLHCAVVDLGTGYWSTVYCSSSNTGYICQTEFLEPLSTPTSGSQSSPLTITPRPSSLSGCNQLSKTAIIIGSVMGCILFLLLVVILILLLRWGVKLDDKDADMVDNEML